MPITARRLARKGRRWIQRGIRRRSVPHALVLVYHRVATAAVDPWGLCVAPERFDDQIRALRRLADIVPLDRLPEAMRSAGRSRPVLAITFDDGYLDNLTEAKPVLERYEAPATVFLATGCLERGEPFWWDTLDDVVLRSERLPVRLRLEGGERAFDWHDETLAAPPARSRLHAALWEWLVRLRDPERRGAIRELARWAGRVVEPDPSALPMSRQQVRQLVSGGLVTIGAHSVTHARLTDLDRDEQLAEILQSRSDCSRLVGKPPAYFAYPFGAFDAVTHDCVRQAGFTTGYALDDDLAWADRDPLCLQRFSVANWSGRQLEHYLRWYWLP